ncbi:hypothetical protein LINSTU_238 [Mycobacterium phage LinStu]|uniref:Uncharacterized protein n=2 Tax=Bixzunavirus TaxID=680114 RepID=A0A8F2E7K8_9CAUD|nr:hypothetical protein LINSTU_238 [Mycobacterium phage LinStu]YP_010510624.1 hypothetical protein OLP41_gp114 [Mycobacterium phage I3]AEL98443.1 hypothetical protein LINSTU_238 [Mycobacterium phage LinStu]QWT30490.1 hypothetical protein PBI_I3_251 [Mycobacterium phage I3]
MGLLVFLVITVASWVPVVMLPTNSGAWLLAGLVAGVLTLFLGAGLTSAQAISDGGTSAAYYLWWALAIGLDAVGGVLAVYCLVSLIARGAGIDIDAEITS